MTDTEIIKTWEKCANPANDCYGDDYTCKYSKYDKGTGECFKQLRKDVTDLINRQKTEIERLNEKYSRMKFNLESVLAERADHTEAIKEFTSRIEGVLSLHPAQAKYYYEIKKEYIKENENETD